MCRTEKEDFRFKENFGVTMNFKVGNEGVVQLNIDMIVLSLKVLDDG